MQSLFNLGFFAPGKLIGRLHDFSASWIRDASFTLYALIRLGFTEEANGKDARMGSFHELLTDPE